MLRVLCGPHPYNSKSRLTSYNRRHWKKL